MYVHSTQMTNDQVPRGRLVLSSLHAVYHACQFYITLTWCILEVELKTSPVAEGTDFGRLLRR